MPSSRACAAVLFAAVLIATSPELSSAQFQAPNRIQTLSRESQKEGDTAGLTAEEKKDTVTLRGQCLKQFEEVRASRDPSKPRLVSYGCSSRLFGTNLFTTREAIDDYFGGLRTGRVVALSMGDDGSALYSEIASDNLWLSAALGFARFGLGAMVSEGEAGDSASAEQIFTGAGNAVAFLSVPLFAWYNAIQPFDASKGEVIRHVDSFVTLSLGADLPDMGSSIEDPAYNFRVGTQWTYTHSAMDGLLGLFGHFDAGYVKGFSDFTENYGVREGAHDKLGFGLLTVAAGIDLNSVLRIGASLAQSSLPNIPLSSRLTLQLLPR